MKESLDFIVIGAQKAGTTSLFEYLRRHPQISMPVGKEMPFFSDAQARGRGWEGYAQRAFGAADPGTRWGTATPQYMVGGLLDEPNPTRDGERHDERTVPLRIRAHSPEARLIAILRDPAERARSHHRMSFMEGIERRPFDRAIAELLQEDALAQARREPRETTGYVAWGEYGRILAGYFEVFDAEQILVLFTEELERDPRTVLRRIFAFLEVEEEFVPDNLGMKYRVGGAQRRLSWLGTYSSLSPLALQRAASRNPATRGLWHALPERRRRQIDRAFGHVVYRLDLWNRRTETDTAEPDGATLERLRAHFERDGERLTELLGTAPPWHGPVPVL
jgi:hypothetical protein